MHTAGELNQSRRKQTLWTMAGVLIGILLVPLLPYTIAAVKDIVVVKEGITNPNPGAQLWKDIRQRDKKVEGTTQVQGVDTGILISKEGEDWRQYRVQDFVPSSAIIYGVVLGLFALYYIVRGKIRIEGERSGETIQRTTKAERYIHWITAVIFVLLALSGLILLYGRWVLIPLLGPEGFSATATASKVIHNYLGPVFLVALIAMFFGFIRDSLFNFKVDMQWFMKAGGYLGGSHPSSEKYNAGQKAWFWVAILGGLVLVASGLVLDFANYGQGRIIMQDAHVIHTISSVVVIGFFFVHLYLATIGVEGSFDAMVSGTVPEEFAKQHHNLWYEAVKGKKSG
ncbi:formate dehydrogenase subunit gamma [Kaarinaea lacus]